MCSLSSSLLVIRRMTTPWDSPILQHLSPNQDYSFMSFLYVLLDFIIVNLSNYGKKEHQVDLRSMPSPSIGIILTTGELLAHLNLLNWFMS